MPSYILSAYSSLRTQCLQWLRRTHCIRGIVWLDALSVEEESHTLNALALTVAESIHQLLELGRALDLEEHLIVVVRHFDVQML